MKQELEDILVNKFPLLYADYHKSAMQSCMGRGFECGDGWFNLLHGLSLAIQNHIDWENKQADEAKAWNLMVQEGKKPDWWGDRVDSPALRKVPRRVKQVKVTQVKEKFGTLRFSVPCRSKTINNYIQCAEHISYVTCERCGAPGEIISTGWVRVSCPVCEEERIQKEAQYEK